MSTPLYPEGVPEIDADPPSLDSGCVKGMGTAYPQALPRLGGDALPYTPPHFVGPGYVLVQIFTCVDFKYLGL